VFAPPRGNEPVVVQLQFLHPVKDAKSPSQTASLASAADDLIKRNVECAINTLNGNYKTSKKGRKRLSKYKNPLRALMESKGLFQK